MLISIYLIQAYVPIADTGDCTEGVTVTVIGSLDVPQLFSLQLL